MFPTVSISEDRSLRLEKEKGRIPKNKQVYILRPCMIHGPGNKGNLNLLYNVVKKESLGLLAILIIAVRLLQSITFVM